MKRWRIKFKPNAQLHDTCAVLRSLALPATTLALAGSARVVPEAKRVGGQVCAMRRLTVCAEVRQNITLLYKGESLPYNVFHKQTKQSDVVLAKDLNKTIQTKSAPVPHKPAPDHPWRTFLLWRTGDISALG